MKNLKYAALCFVLFNFCAVAKAQDDVIQADKMKIIVDGDEADWQDAMTYYDEKSMLSYGVANDNENIYVLVKAGDRMSARKFTGGGVEVWLSADNDEKRKTGIKYPVPMSWQERREMREKAATRADFEKNQSSEYSTMELKGFENIENGTYKIDSIAIKAAYNGTRDDAYAEYKIPISEFSKFKNAVEAGDNVFAVGIMLNGITMGGPGGGGFGGGHGGRGGRGNFGGGEPQTRDTRKMSESKSFWIHVKLAQ